MGSGTTSPTTKSPLSKRIEPPNADFSQLVASFKSSTPLDESATNILPTFHSTQESSYSTSVLPFDEKPPGVFKLDSHSSSADEPDIFVSRPTEKSLGVQRILSSSGYASTASHLAYARLRLPSDSDPATNLSASQGPSPSSRSSRRASERSDRRSTIMQLPSDSDDLPPLHKYGHLPSESDSLPSQPPQPDTLVMKGLTADFRGELPEPGYTKLPPAHAYDNPPNPRRVANRLASLSKYDGLFKPAKRVDSKGSL
ncbi:MAG: hypothetical protein KVP17_001100 [Porospora cf. gigantea B]|uniref:uncharacterized protein n=1 Tax=Porospora cf. gigantea B TaxID=2853592 RepID=UPI0035717C0E|nr:MAG: hypothetical protein KVP17_001100 [Porospora cf. gigantea B]